MKLLNLLLLSFISLSAMIANVNGCEPNQIKARIKACEPFDNALECLDYCNSYQCDAICVHGACECYDENGTCTIA
jgi:hypothetical protein